MVFFTARQTFVQELQLYLVYSRSLFPVDMIFDFFNVFELPKQVKNPKS